jgi:hypothetical protein
MVLLSLLVGVIDLAGIILIKKRLAEGFGSNA